MLEESNIINQNIIYNNYDTFEDINLIGRESYEDVSYEVSSKFSDPITTKSIRINSFKTRLLVNELKQFNSVQPHEYILEFYGITKSELSTQSTKTTSRILLRELSCSQESYNCESELYYISKTIISGKSVNGSSISSIGYVNNYKGSNNNNEHVRINDELIINDDINIASDMDNNNNNNIDLNDLNISFSLYNKSEIYQDFYKSLNSNFTDSSNLSIINSKKELKSIAIINSKFLDYMNINMNDPNKKESFHQLLQLSISHLDNFIDLKILVNSMRNLNNCNELINQINSFAEQHDEDPAKLLQTLLDHNQDENSTFARLIGFFYKYGFNSSSSSSSSSNDDNSIISSSKDDDNSITSSSKDDDNSITSSSKDDDNSITSSSKDDDNSITSSKDDDNLINSSSKDDDNLMINFHTYEKLAENAAEGGNVNALNELGYFYENGICTDKDDQKAFIYYLKSADGGNATAQNEIGYYFENGIGTDKDENKAFQYYLKSAENAVEGGSIEAQNSLGLCYQNGTGTIKDEKKAFQCFMKSFENGDSDSYYYLAAKEGNAAAQNELGYYYENGICTTKNVKQAFHYYFKAANNGNAAAQNNLGYYFENGIGTEKDERKAFLYYMKSAESGNTAAQW
ncbi:HCP-like protein [Gigaspora margarita]|uniref:HCP-like protein n=1 Tax=Gigaspora margarita TaxID=4874 RepID=A0A8H4AY04_GIGMA|nr:HCP-like protein [Gigaspora margarita]